MGANLSDRIGTRIRLVPATLAALAAFCTIAALADVLQWGGGPSSHRWSDLGWTLAALSALVACTRTAVRFRGHDRLVWTLFALGSGSWFVGQLAWNYYDLISGFPPAPNYSDAAFLAFVPFCGAGLLLIGRGGTLSRVLHFLDAAVLACACSVFFTSAFWGDLQRSQLSHLGMATAILYPVAYGTLALVVFLLPIRQWWRNTSIKLLLAGLLCEVAAFMGWTPLILKGTFAPGTVLDAVWLVGMLLIALSAIAFDGFPPRQAEAQAFGVGVVAPLSATVLVAVLRLIIQSGFGWTPETEHILPRLVAGIVLLTGARLGITVAYGHRLFEEAREARADAERMADELREREASFRHQALHDALTDLPNRVLLHDRLEQAILVAHREGESLALLLMDLDGFKDVNDTFGHHFGDLLLQQVGHRLRGNLRESDTVARLGGDEFAVILSAVDEVHTEEGTRRILACLAQPFTVEGRNLRIHASIGIAMFPDHGGDAHALLRRADVAMYVAKRANDGGYAVYSSEEDLHSPEKLALVDDLRRAIDGDELTLHYQPIINVTTGCAEHVEALVRWNHPQRGAMRPDQFISLAEETGLIKALTMSVLRMALRQDRVWRDNGLDISVAVNLSTRNLSDPQLPEEIADLLAAFGVKPSNLIIEITESTIMSDPSLSMSVLTCLHDTGVQIAIDDFGTGYSSLGYLRNLPADEIKIDRSFVMDMTKNEGDATIVRSVIDLGHNLNLQVIAEGVEDEGTLQLLQDMGCDMAQGYHIGRPVPAEEFVAWLRDQELSQAS